MMRKWRGKDEEEEGEKEKGKKGMGDELVGERGRVRKKEKEEQE